MKTITFQPTVYPGKPPIPPMDGELTGYGLVIHLSCQQYCRDAGIYDVSDPVTGARICSGCYPGRDDAIDELAQFVRDYYGKNPKGDFRDALQKAREKLAKPEDFWRPGTAA